MKYHNKLVRDKIPTMCEDSGATPQTRTLNDDAEYLSALVDKLGEEAAEVKEDPCLEELVDVLEVLRSIGIALGYTPDQIEAARAQKAEERGGFEERVFLTSTDTKE